MGDEETVQLPWGDTVAIPAGMSQEAVNKNIQDKFGEQIKGYFAVQKMGPVERIARGFGHTVAETSRGIAQLGIKSGVPEEVATAISGINPVLGSILRQGAMLRDRGATPEALEGAEKLARQRSEPLMQTWTGWGGGVAGDIAQGAAMGGSPIAKLGPAVGGAVTGAVQQALQPTAGDESRLMNAAEGAAGGAIGGFVGDLGLRGLGAIAKRAVMPFTDRLVAEYKDLRQVLSQHGVPMDNAQATGSKLAKTLRMMAGDSAFTSPDSFPYIQARRFTQAALRYMGIDGAPNASPQVMESGKQALKSTYNEVAARTNLELDEQGQREFTALKDDAAQHLSADNSDIIGRQVDNILRTLENNTVGNTSYISGAAYKNLQTSLGKVENNSATSPYITELRKTLTGMLSRQAAPEDRALLGQTDQRYGAMKAIEDSIGDGYQVNPTKLANFLDNRNSQWVYGQGANTGLSDLARAGRGLLGRASEDANSGTTRRWMAQMLLSGHFSPASLVSLGIAPKVAQWMVYSPTAREYMADRLGLLPFGKEPSVITLPRPASAFGPPTPPGMGNQGSPAAPGASPAAASPSPAPVQAPAPVSAQTASNAAQAMPAANPQLAPASAGLTAFNAALLKAQQAGVGRKTLAKLTNAVTHGTDAYPDGMPYQEAIGHLQAAELVTSAKNGASKAKAATPVAPAEAVAAMKSEAIPAVSAAPAEASPSELPEGVTPEIMDKKTRLQELGRKLTLSPAESDERVALSKEWYQLPSAIRDAADKAGTSNIPVTQATEGSRPPLGTAAFKAYQEAAALPARTPEEYAQALALMKATSPPRRQPALQAAIEALRGKPTVGHIPDVEPKEELENHVAMLSGLLKSEGIDKTTGQATATYAPPSMRALQEGQKALEALGNGKGLPQTQATAFQPGAFNSESDQRVAERTAQAMGWQAPYIAGMKAAQEDRHQVSLAARRDRDRATRARIRETLAAHEALLRFTKGQQ